MLLHALLRLLDAWRPAFHQDRSARRAAAQALGTLASFGRRTLSRSLWVLGRQQQDWSAEYRLHARSQWKPGRLFHPIVENALPFCVGRYVVAAIDDTRLHKTGRHIQSAFYQRDPLSPKFRFNLMFGLRFLQISLLLPLYRKQKASPRALPVRFEEVPALKHPARKAPPEQWTAWRQAVKKSNLSTHAVTTISDLRRSLDEAGQGTKRLLIVGDGSFCNRTLFATALDRTEIIARARRDLKLCRKATPGTRLFYDKAKFTAEQLRQDESLAWRKARIYHGGQWRKVRYKEVSGIYWQSGARQRPLRLFVVAPIPYQAPGCKRKYYRHPAYLLTTDLSGTPREMLQAYFDRWQIEVNHREEKDTLGIGQAQLRSAQSVPRQPAFAVAAYSALMLAALLTFGPGRDPHYQPLPKWRRNADRPSCLDLITLLRKEMAENPDLLAPLGFQIQWKDLGLSAAA
jgi:DDE superfamily endonuclease